jgi:type IV secretory pathway TrbF-like protein
MILKKKNTAATSDPRQSYEKLLGGRRQGENENPYLSARRTWNDHMQTVMSSRQAWQIMGILSLLVALVGVAGMLHIGQQSKFIPYVVQVDKLGQTAAVSIADKAAPADPRVIASALSAFISNARLVTPDVVLQRKAVFDVYALLPANAPATQKMTEFYNGTEDSSPFKRATQEMVSTEISSAMALTADTWQVDWMETTRNRQGVMKGQPVPMRAMMTLFIAAPTSATTEEQVRKNPLGIFVRDFSWSRQQPIH